MGRWGDKEVWGVWGVWGERFLPHPPTPPTPPACPMPNAQCPMPIAQKIASNTRPVLKLAFRHT
ncbi:hypothetical protein H6G94_18510 [Nostoc punctiforme FACHB-252]|uniref:Histidine kinase n=1 Tax=Nostoc punctiforme FACHB-252 TaxID=1357509 RepID=A0ABR8HCR4_NOSPU|nr:hypothetical protein [Nostoc punctiforme FACHB-252]